MHSLECPSRVGRRVRRSSTLLINEQPDGTCYISTAAARDICTVRLEPVGTRTSLELSQSNGSLQCATTKSSLPLICHGEKPSRSYNLIILIFEGYILDKKNIAATHLHCTHCRNLNLAYEAKKHGNPG